VTTARRGRKKAWGLHGGVGDGEGGDASDARRQHDGGGRDLAQAAATTNYIRVGAVSECLGCLGGPLAGSGRGTGHLHMYTTEA
jgi:hypothetical protein